MSGIVLSELAIYPVKSLAQIQLQTSYLHRFGLHHDRRWMLVDHQGIFITQRQVPQMCLIQADLIYSNLTPLDPAVSGIQLQTPGMTALEVSIPSPHKITKITVWNDTCDAHDCGDEAANWLSHFLQRDCRLVYFPDDAVRAVDPAYAKPEDQTAFSDGFPLLLISQASLDDL
ncbi:MAG: MOSC N-terminal beta barrel domain-containing protein, partial [Gammaproteobacteria bacterium]|nr:MOSC N-terminal beta barrel domain-containing protein [Gammaproteobacteria bacterium]